MKDGAAVFDVHNGPVGKHAVHAGDEDIPLIGAVEIVAHEEAAAQQEIAQLGGLRVGQIPVPHFDAVEPGPVVDFVAVA